MINRIVQLPLLSTLLLIALVFNFGYGQRACGPNCRTTNSINVTSGIDNNGNLLQIGMQEPNWMLMNNPPLNGSTCPQDTFQTLQASVNPPQAFTVSHDGLANNLWVNQPGSQTIAPRNFGTSDSGFGCNNASPNQPFIFDRRFCVCSSDSVFINVNYRGDDQLRLQLISPNGNVLASSPQYVYTSSMPPAISWSNASFFLTPGTYRLRAELINTQNTTIGFSVTGTITSANNSLSENSASCCTDYAVSIQKILDVDCDGAYTSGTDLIGGAGWQYQVLSGGTVVTTGTTDQFGTVIIPGLPAGSYTIRELPNSSSDYSSPFVNNIQVTVGPNNPLGFINFYNCLKSYDCCETELLAYFEPGSPDAVQGVINGVPASIATESLGVHKDAAIPITEFRVSITDIQYDYNYQSCANCIENPALWGSLSSSTSTIAGSNGNSLSFPSTPYPVGNPGNMINQNGNTRELVWTNPEGVMLQDGADIDISYLLPPASDIPCCVTKVRICTKISWKDANCRVCERFNCTTINLERGAGKSMGTLPPAKDLDFKFQTANVGH